jgi:hypothetical protein
MDRRLDAAGHAPGIARTTEEAIVDERSDAMGGHVARPFPFG